MIGNDIVDLTDPETQKNAPHPRFDGRVFARSELLRLRLSGAPNRLRWMLWAAKEAAYKAMKKIHPHMVFSPVRFVVRLDQTLRGSVECPNGSLDVSVTEEAMSIHAIAASAAMTEQNILSGTEFLASEAAENAEQPGQAARELALRSLERRLDLPAGTFSIEKHDRIPVLFRQGVRSEFDLSLSHHGRLVAFACEMGRREGLDEVRA